MRDYAKKNRSSSSRKKGLGVLVFFLMMLAFSFLLGMLYVKHKRKGTPFAQISATENSASVAPSKNPSEKFDFYTLLPKLAVPENDTDSTNK